MVIKMPRILAEKKIPKYFSIYKQIYENPFISYNQLAKRTGMSHRTVTKYVAEMESSFMLGPAIFLKPSQSCTEYFYFLNVRNPFSIREKTERCFATFGDWNLFLVSNTPVDYTVIDEYKDCFFKGINGGIYLSEVTTCQWIESMKNIQMLPPPDKKSFLCTEVLPEIPWNKKEWALYNEFRYNVRKPIDPVLKKVGVSESQYKEWLSSLPLYADIQTAFYPQGINNYLTYDILIESEYQEHIVRALGQLPATSVCISLGEYVFGRLSIGIEGEVQYGLLLQYLKREGFYTDVSWVMHLRTIQSPIFF
jgi:hypothetical protein